MSDARSCYRNNKTSAIPSHNLYVTNLSLSGYKAGGSNRHIGTAFLGNKRADFCCFVSKWYYLRADRASHLEGDMTFHAQAGITKLVFAP